MHLFVFKRDIMLKGNPADKHHESDRLERKKKKEEEEQKKKKKKKKTATESKAHGRFSLYFFILTVESRQSTT